MADRWQFQLLAERLRARGLQVTQKVSDPANLDRWATNLKRWFSARQIRIPNHLGLIEQLEGLEGEELRRRDRVRFTATGHNHDDAAIALCLSAEFEQKHIGVLRMAEISECLRESHLPDHNEDCFLWKGHYIPSDPLCRQCPAYQSVKVAHGLYVQRTSEDVSLRGFVTRGLIAPNDFVSRRKWRQWTALNL